MYAAVELQTEALPEPCTMRTGETEMDNGSACVTIDNLGRRQQHNVQNRLLK